VASAAIPGASGLWLIADAANADPARSGSSTKLAIRLREAIDAGKGEREIASR
jgi:hypothetical protein